MRPNDDFHFVNSVFCAGTKYVGVARNAIQFLARIKKFGTAQNILGLVEGQGMSLHFNRGFYQLQMLCKKFKLEEKDPEKE